MNHLWIIICIVSSAIGFWAGWLLKQHFSQIKLARASSTAKDIIEEAKAEAENIKQEKLLEAKEEIFQRKQSFESEIKNKENEFHRRRNKLSQKELNIDRKVDLLNKKENELNNRKTNLDLQREFISKREKELEELIREENLRLEKISGLSSAEAKKLQMENMIEQAKQEVTLEIQEIKENAKKTADIEAREIILQAVQKSQINHIVDTTVSILHLPDDEMKGRIIGREGRNIRAFESATGIEVLIDDTPQTVILSGFDTIRREIAKTSMEKLIYDGRIHPGRIEEVVAKTEQEIDEKIMEIGEQTLHEVGLHNLHPELIRLLGRQHFRTSYGQNLLLHSKEVATLAGQMASQLGLDITLAKRAGLLHDIGKTAEEYDDTPHYEIGVELAKKFGESEVVQNSIACQKQTSNEEIKSPICVLVQISNAISVSRPGAQKEMLENYIKRMRTLETVANSFPEVIKSYAIQAGKEIRVIVEHSVANDSKTQILADNIAKKLKKELEFPGQIKITAIREFRSVDFAK